MKEAYDIFLKHLRADQPVSGFDRLSDYLDWLKINHLRIDTRSLIIGGSFKFNFKAQCVETVLEDVLALIKEYSVAGYSTNTVDRHDVHLFNTDAGEPDEEYIESCGNQYNAKWIDQSNRNIGVYRILDLADHSEIIHVMNEDACIKVYTDYEKELSHMEGWEDPKSFDKDYGKYGDYVGEKWLDLLYEIDEHLIFDVYKDVRKILKGFMVIHCADMVYTLDDGIGMSYYVLSGYNSIDNCGEGLMIPDFDY